LIQGFVAETGFLQEYTIRRCEYCAEIAFLSKESAIKMTKYDYETTPVEVVAGPLSFSASKGLKVN
jgi:hypothetical protein